MPNGFKLWSSICAFNPTLLTTPYDSASEIGKLEWVYKNLRNKGGALPNTIFSREKQIYAKDGNLLIDDMEFNSLSWEKKGGKAILHRDDQLERTTQKITSFLF
jgi:hypothetical protein